MKPLADLIRRYEHLRDHGEPEGTDAGFRFLCGELVDAVLELTAWRPMETAPRDGRQILAYRPAGPRVIQWNWDRGWGQPSNAGLLPVSEEAFCGWLPIPAPPPEVPR